MAPYSFLPDVNVLWRIDTKISEEDPMLNIYATLSFVLRLLGTNSDLIQTKNMSKTVNDRASNQHKPN